MEVSGQLHAPATLPPWERAPGTHCIGNWVSPRAGLNLMEKRKSLAPVGESKLETSTVQSVVSILKGSDDGV
jgi:hypothetical protein